MVDKKPPYSDALLAELRDRLLVLLREFRGEYDTLAEDVLQPSGQESGIENFAEYGSDTYTEALGADLLEKRSALVKECEQALDRHDGLGEYEYGLCESCQDEPRGLCPTCPWIPAKRLRYQPFARHCVEMQQALEREGRISESA